MLLHRDGLIELNYDAATDILTVSWPDITKLNSSEMDYSFNKLKDFITYYDIKKLLIDSRFNKVEVDKEEYSTLVERIYNGLRTTRLEMTARLGSLDRERESKARKHAAELINHLKPSFAFQNFDDPGMALQWLRMG